MRTGDSPGPLPPPLAATHGKSPKWLKWPSKSRRRVTWVAPVPLLSLSMSSESLHLCIASTAAGNSKGRTGPMGVARVLISKVFAMPSCFASNTQKKKKEKNERKISVIKNQMIFPLLYPIPPSGSPFPASGGPQRRRQKISSLILVSLLLQLHGGGWGRGGGSGWFIHN